jgi:FMN phosphatase YigB (HAD superfamily)/predicted SAM-dependent methyltransferase
MKLAILDFDGTLVRLKTDYDSLRKELRTQKLDVENQYQYHAFERFEMAKAGEATEIPEARKFIALLKEKGYAVIIVSNSGRNVIKSVMERLNFIGVPYISRETCSYHKPDKRVLGVTPVIPTETIGVGDSDCDRQLANNLGARFYSSISEAMRGLNFRCSLHNEEVFGRELEFLKRYCTGLTLDIGCGNRPSGQINVDVVPMRNDVKQMNAMDLKFEAGKFDSVLMIHCIEHIENVNLALAEVRRVLNRHGYLGVVVPDKAMSGFDLTHVHHLDWKEWKKKIEHAGFKFVSVKGVSTMFDGKQVIFSYSLVFRRVAY